MHHLIPPMLKEQTDNYLNEYFPGAIAIRTTIADYDHIRVFFRRTESSPLESQLFPWIKNSDSVILQLPEPKEKNNINDDSFEVIK